MKRTLVVSSFVAGLLTSGVAAADQCQAFDKALVEWATKLIKKGTRVVAWCKPCGEPKPTASKVVRTVSSRRFDDKLSELIVDGKSVDLAYLFVQTGKKMFTNVAKAVGCPATGIDSFLTAN
ncbi:MAG: hypothetical protein HYY84_18435 [Deltaproteobacteria bacterium]|nr:hypothetical protein [Deltaproteobacteria bacterium]